MSHNKINNAHNSPKCVCCFFCNKYKTLGWSLCHFTFIVSIANVWKSFSCIACVIVFTLSGTMHFTLESNKRLVFTVLAMPSELLVDFFWSLTFKKTFIAKQRREPLHEYKSTGFNYIVHERGNWSTIKNSRIKHMNLSFTNINRIDKT